MNACCEYTKAAALSYYTYPPLLFCLFTHTHTQTLTTITRTTEKALCLPTPSRRNLLSIPCLIRPGITCWLQRAIHSHCPLGLITINLTSRLSDTAGRSASLGEMLTKIPRSSALLLWGPTPLSCHHSVCGCCDPMHPSLLLAWLIPLLASVTLSSYFFFYTVQRFAPLCVCDILFFLFVYFLPIENFGRFGPKTNRCLLCVTGHSFLFSLLLMEIPPVWIQCTIGCFIAKRCGGARLFNNKVLIYVN